MEHGTNFCRVRHMHRVEDNIKIDLQEVGLGGGAWTGLFWPKIGTDGGHW